jgi:hypothetical protein
MPNILHAVTEGSSDYAKAAARQGAESAASAAGLDPQLVHVAETCAESGDLNACGKAAAQVVLQTAASAAGLDPQIVQAAQTCVESGDLNACGKAAAVAGATAVCIGFTGGAAAPLCGPLATAVVNLVWPVIISVVGAIADAGAALAHVALEAIGLEQAPEFRDVAIRMQAAAVGQLQAAIRDASNAIADAIVKTRRQYGYDSVTIFVRDRIRIDQGIHEGEYKWADTGRDMPLKTAAEQLIWDRMANDSRFAAGYTRTGKYGVVGLTAGSMGSDRAKNIESAHTLVSMVPWWHISWDAAWERDDAFDFGARALGEFYARRMEALHVAITAAMRNMIELESINPGSIAATKKNAEPERSAVRGGGSASKKGGAGGALLAVGILAGLSALGYHVWRKYGT